MDPKLKLGTHVRAKREALGLSQEGLADRAGIHRTYIGSMERGERNVSLIILLAVAKALKCKPSVLLECFDSEKY